MRGEDTEEAASRNPFAAGGDNEKVADGDYLVQPTNDGIILVMMAVEAH